ncbi:MAG TPA: S49 family peptidase, partial [Bacteroidia bacterium]|nr:S49 family peptidase [Bacteroidia bacterium]
TGYRHTGQEGRKMETAMVDSIGQGRVWSATDAKRIGLVDIYGGLNDAVALAAKKAGLDNYRIKELPEQKDPIQEILEDMKGESESMMMPDYMKESVKLMKYLRQISEQDKIQARMPFGIAVE